MGEPKRVTSDELASESLLLLGEGHCFRDQVLEICHTVRARERSPLAKTVEGGSLETIRQMVAGGVGVTVLPATSTNTTGGASELIRILPFARPAPTRRVGLAWRRSFPVPRRSRRCARRSSPATSPGGEAGFLITSVTVPVPWRAGR